MQIDEQTALDLLEDSGDLCFVDIEANGLRADYSYTLVVSIKPYGKKPYSTVVNQIGNDVGVVMWAKEELEKYVCWCTYYGKGFDLPFLNTRLLKWGKQPIEKRHHIDLYYTLKANTLVSRRSMAQMEGFLNLENQKMGVSPNVWSEVGLDKKHLRTMKQRCESDVTVLEDLYRKSRHVIRDIKR